MITCYNAFSLENKTILVTGASSGIGRQVAVTCSRFGAKVIIVARNEERLAETLTQMSGEGHISISADLSNGSAIASLVKECPKIDGCVLCAGINFMAPVAYTDAEKTRSLFDINFFGTMELARLLYKTKKLNKGGSIVLIDSISGVTGVSFGNCGYGCSKAALNAFGKFAAQEFGRRGVRVNCICPGMIETPMIHGDMLSQEDLDRDMRENYPLGRYGKPVDIANGVVYLLSDASAWVTGTSLIIDGGRSLM